MLAAPLLGLLILSVAPSLQAAPKAQPAAPKTPRAQPTAATPRAQPSATPTAQPQASTPLGPRFTVLPHADGPVVRDNHSGRTWLRAPAKTTHDWAGARATCDALTLAGRSDWRLPRVEELDALLSGPLDAPLPVGHPFTVAGTYWSSTQASAAAAHAMIANNGNAAPVLTTIQNQAWCVRGGGNTAYPNSNPRFQVVGKTVEDRHTARVWQRGGTTRGTWFAVRRLCHARGPEWRLPTRDELTGLLDLAAPESPKLPVGHPFFNTWAPYDSQPHWLLTSTTAAAARTLRFSDGMVATADKLAATHTARCIKMDLAATWPAGPVGRFTLILGDAAVLDQDTRLQWDRAPAPAANHYPDALAACATKTLGGQSGWRLPTLDELQTLLDDHITSGPHIPAGHPFTGVTATKLWTTTPHLSDMTTLSLADGGVGHMSKTGGAMLGWCVRPAP